VEKCKLPLEMYYHPCKFLCATGKSIGGIIIVIVELTREHKAVM